jgi:acetyltransferase
MSRLAGYAETVVRPLPPLGKTAFPPLPDDLPSILTEHHAKALLAPFGLPESHERLAGSAAEAAQAADALGYPVALKIASPDIAHKTEADGVILDLKERQGVIATFDRIIASAKQYKPAARIEGVLVQKMAPRGRELVIGMVNDPTFGPIMMVGLGGTMVELMGDVVHRPAPVDAAEATDMLQSLKSAPLLTGFRGSASIDLTPAAELIANLSQAARAYRDRIAEMELNPVILHDDGSGLTIADALIMLKE